RSAHAFIFHGGTVVLKVDDKEVAGNTMERSIALILQWTRTSTSAQSSDGRISQDTGEDDGTSIRYFCHSANSPSIGFVFERSARWLVRPSGSRAGRRGRAPGSKIDRRPPSLAAAEPYWHCLRWRGASS